MRYDFVTVDSRDFPKQRLVVIKSDLVGSVKTKPQFRQFMQEPELMTTTDLALANTLLPNTELNQDIYWHQISMFASTANKYLACPETSWLQLGKTMRFPYGEAFLIPSEGVFSSNMFSSCLAARSSPAGRITPRVCATLFLEQTLVVNTSLLFWGKQGMYRSSSTRWWCPQKQCRWVPGEQGPSSLLLCFPVTSDSHTSVRKHHLSHSWQLGQVAGPHFSAIITYLVAKHGRNVCNGC